MFRIASAMFRNHLLVWIIVMIRKGLNKHHHRELKLFINNVIKILLMLINVLKVTMSCNIYEVHISMIWRSA